MPPTNVHMVLGAPGVLTRGACVWWHAEHPATAGYVRKAMLQWLPAPL